MPVSVATFQRRSEPTAKQTVDPLDRVLQGLQIANSAFGIVSNLEAIQTARQNRGLVESKMKSEAAAAQEAKVTEERMRSGKYTEPEYEKVLGSQKFIEIKPPKEGEEMPPSVLRRTVIGPEGERSVLLRQAKPIEMAATAEAQSQKTQATEKKTEAEQAFKTQYQQQAQKNAEKLIALRKRVETAKEPSPAELAKVKQAEGMIETNNGLESSLTRFDPTSRAYLGQMKLPIGAKAKEWQQYETSARQFIDPLARVRTGAAMPEHEFESYMQQFFPLPGDTQETIQQKAFLRQKGIEEVMAMGRRARTDVQPKPQGPQAKPGIKTKRAADLEAL
jgi:hypothetical protein